ERVGAFRAVPRAAARRVAARGERRHRVVHITSNGFVPHGMDATARRPPARARHRPRERTAGERVNPTSSFVDIDGSLVHVVRWQPEVDEGNPPIVLAHGLGGSTLTWHLVGGALARTLGT